MNAHDGQQPPIPSSSILSMLQLSGSNVGPSFMEMVFANPTMQQQQQHQHQQYHQQYQQQQQQHQQQQQQHTPASSESSIEPAPARKAKKRKRTSKACVQCRKSHACCDDSRPCRRCVRLDLQCYDQCTGKTRGGARTRKNKKKKETTMTTTMTAADSVPPPLSSLPLSSPSPSSFSSSVVPIASTPASAALLPSAMDLMFAGPSEESPLELENLFNQYLYSSISCFTPPLIASSSQGIDMHPDSNSSSSSNNGGSSVSNANELESLLRSVQLMQADTAPSLPLQGPDPSSTSQPFPSQEQSESIHTANDQQKGQRCQLQQVQQTQESQSQTQESQSQSQSHQPPSDVMEFKRMLFKTMSGTFSHLIKVAKSASQDARERGEDGNKVFAEVILREVKKADESFSSNMQKHGCASIQDRDVLMYVDSIKSMMRGFQTTAEARLSALAAEEREASLSPLTVSSSSSSSSFSSSSSSESADELRRLRLENRALKGKNRLLKKQLEMQVKLTSLMYSDSSADESTGLVFLGHWGRVVGWNKTLRTRLGFQQHDLGTRISFFREILHEGSMKRLLEKLFQNASKGTAKFHTHKIISVDLIRSDGASIHACMQVTPFHDTLDSPPLICAAVFTFDDDDDNDSESGSESDADPGFGRYDSLDMNSGDAGPARNEN